MESTNDGFVIAEADLKMRGPGDLEGTQQSGLPINLKIAHLGKDQQILQYSRDVAQEILAKDPSLEQSENLKLKILISKSKKENMNWREIS
jgi:ATP-dependent DNA helicase RecG